MTSVVRELLLHEDVFIQVTVKNEYLVTDVVLIMKGVVRDRNKEFKFRIEEPYGRLVNFVLDCKRHGTEIRK